MRDYTPKFKLSFTILDCDIGILDEDKRLLKTVGFVCKSHKQEVFWVYSTANIMTYDLDDALNSFFSELEILLLSIADVVKRNKLETKLDVCINIKGNETPSLFFDRKNLALLQDLNSEIDIDLYVGDYR